MLLGLFDSELGPVDWDAGIVACELVATADEDTGLLLALFGAELRLLAGVDGTGLLVTLLESELWLAGVVNGLLLDCTNGEL